MAVINIAVKSDVGATSAATKTLAKDLDQVGVSAKKASGNASELDRALASGNKSMLAFGAAAGIGAVGFTTLQSAVSGAISAAVDAVANFAKLGSDLTDLAARTGLTTQAIQELQFAGSLVGVSFDAIATAVAQMQKKLIAGSDAFAELGLSVGQLLELSPDQQLAAIAEAIRRIPDPAGQAAAAMAIFGRSGVQLLPLLKSDLADVADEARRLGIVLGDDVVAAGDRLDDATTKLGATWSGLKNQLAAVVVESGLVGWLETATVGVGNLASGVAQLNSGLSNTGPASSALLFLLEKLSSGTVAGSIAQLSQLGSLLGSLQGPSSAGAPKVGMGILAPPAQPSVVGPTPAEIAAMDSQITKLIRTEQAAAQAASKARVEAYEWGRVLEDVGDQGMEGLGEAMLTAQTASLTLADGFGTVAVSAADMDAAVKGVIQAELDAAHAAEEAARKNYEAAAAEAKRILGLQKLADELAGIAGIIGSVSGLFEALGISADSGLGKAIQGLQGMAEAGANFAASWAAGDVKGMVSAGIQGVTSLIGTIKGLFGKPEWAKVGEEAAEALGLDEAISRELAEAIQKTADDLDLSPAAAALLHITDAMEETKKSAAEMAGPISDLINGIAAGTIPAVEGLQQLDDVFSVVREQATGVGDAMTVAMLSAAKAAGTLTDGMKDFISQQNQLMASGAGKIASAMENIAKVGGPVGERAALFFKGGFEAAIAEQGLLGAVDTLGDQAVALFEKFKKSGNQTAAAMIAPFANIAKQLGGDSPAAKALRGQVELLQGMGEVFEGAANQGLLTAEMQTAFGAQLQDTFKALTAKGIDAKTSMAAIKPELDKAISASQQLGVPLDANTAALKAQAEAMGFAFPVEPMLQVVDLLKTLVQGMGFQLPASANTAATSMQSIGGAAVSASTSATASLSSISTAAYSTSSTVVAAFSGVGAEIMTAIAPAADQIGLELASAFDAGLQGAQQFMSQLSVIAGQQIPIEFKYGAGGLLPPISIPAAAKGLTVEPRPGGTPVILGEAGVREHAIPDPNLRALLAAAIQAGQAQGGGRSSSDGPPIVVRVELERRQLAQATINGHRDNSGGQRSRLRRGGR